MEMQKNKDEEQVGLALLFQEDVEEVVSSHSSTQHDARFGASDETKRAPAVAEPSRILEMPDASLPWFTIFTFSQLKHATNKFSYLIGKGRFGAVYKEKLSSLRAEADNAVTRAEEAEAKVKKLEQALLEKDQEITSLNHRLGVLDSELEKTESKLADFKRSSEDGEHSKTTNEGLLRKIQLLEEELDAAEKNVKETVDKLRQMDVKAEHFERQVQRAEQERDGWEKKYEELREKFEKSKKDLEELERELGGL